MAPALLGVAGAALAFAVRGAPADRADRLRPVRFLGTLATCGFWLFLTAVSMASAYLVFGQSDALATGVGSDAAGSAVFGAGVSPPRRWSASCSRTAIQNGCWSERSRCCAWCSWDSSP
ncbi:hypothetical protein ACFQYP_32380 [Nonomuraea antimicrobica]